METVVIIMGMVLLLFFLSAAMTSFLEGEKRAVYVSMVVGAVLSFPFLLPLFRGVDYPSWLFIAMLGLAGCCLIVLLLPIGGRVRYTFTRPSARIDERDTMFSRRDLAPGSGAFEEYYRRRPSNRDWDDKFRSKPGLLSPDSRYYDPVLFASARSIFHKVEELYAQVDGEPAETKLEVNPCSAAEKVLRMAGKLGAHSAGITKLYDYHLYSFGGRRERYGMEYTFMHKYAIALTVEMNYQKMRTAPAAPTLVESARQYLNGGKIAVELAGYIRSCGYAARAHIDANYHVVCPLVARDAGLGEIGRMGLLMTPVLGPRVRIAVVTTDMPLEPNPVKPDPALIDFCRRCEKCALVCPGQSIPFGPEKETEGVRRWQIHSESCYTYWCQAGTDCGRCVIVCPFSHPDNWFHRLARFGIRNSSVFRRLAVHLDDLFYSKKPRPSGWN
jgi:reductive dehalogenase